MVAAQLSYYIVEVPTGKFHRMATPVASRMRETDPFIAGLIRKLQEEVRAERAGGYRDLD
ncbi:MAG: hypothetical protein N2C12_01410 [Planctomycetales bacterium]